MGILRYCYNLAKDYKQNRQYRLLGISLKELRRLKKEVGEKTTILFGVNIAITNFFWYIHGLNEIFVDKTYLFKTEKKEPVILDCGANIGLSVIFFKKQHPQAKIKAFEADGEIAEILSSNLNKFGFTDVEVIPKAVWIENTTLSFKSDGAVGGQITENNESGDKVEAIRLFDCLNQEIDFLKIDIEGVEYEVLKDCASKLENVKNIFIEYHSFLKNEQKLDEILLLLKEAGFKYYIKEAWNNMPMPFYNERKSHYDLQLNIFGYRL